jgi:hypothetical protein
MRVAPSRAWCSRIQRQLCSLAGRPTVGCVHSRRTIPATLNALSARDSVLGHHDQLLRAVNIAVGTGMPGVIASECLGRRGIARADGVDELAAGRHPDLARLGRGPVVLVGPQRPRPRALPEPVEAADEQRKGVVPTALALDKPGGTGLRPGRKRRRRRGGGWACRPPGRRSTGRRWRRRRCPAVR